MCWMLGGSTVYSRLWTSIHPPLLLSSLQVGPGKLRLYIPPPTTCLLVGSGGGSIGKYLGVVKLGGKTGGIQTCSLGDAESDRLG